MQISAAVKAINLLQVNHNVTKKIPKLVIGI